MQHDDFVVGWVCALDIELAACQLMLDEEYDDLEKCVAADANTYVFGRIGQHNVVIACLPSGQYGTNSASRAVDHMIASFSNLRFAVLVGIGGGAPSKKTDIRLGDIAVSEPGGPFGCVIQYDLGKDTSEGFERTGSLNNPPRALLTAITKLKARHKLGRSTMSTHLSSVPVDFKQPLAGDRLFLADYPHVQGEIDCSVCSAEKEVLRTTRSPNSPIIHYGTIASGNKVIKHGPLRDSICHEYGILCFEMEAAGIMNNLPCLVVRGICDYSDSHKNDAWHDYAAVTAAAYAKELLLVVPPVEVSLEKPAKEVLEAFTQATSDLRVLKTSFQSEYDIQRREKALQWLSPIDHTDQQADSLKRRYKDTGKWFLQHPKFQSWSDGDVKNLLCVGIPGAGKTVLASTATSHLVHHFEAETNIAIAFFYCSYHRPEEQHPDSVIAALLKQLCQALPTLPKEVDDVFQRCSSRGLKPGYDDTFKLLIIVATLFPRVLIVIDALDEYLDNNNTDGRKLSLSLRDLQFKCRQVQILATSRPQSQLLTSFRKDFDDIDELAIVADMEDMKSYLQDRIQDIDCCQDDSTLQVLIQSKIAEAADGMFLLARLHVDSLVESTRKRDIKIYLNNLAIGSEALLKAFETTLQRIDSQPLRHRELAHAVLTWVLQAKRPLRSQELRHALAISPGDTALDPDDLPALRQMIVVCAGLVTLQEESDTVVVSHKTISEYFHQHGPQWYQSAEEAVSLVCMSYLSFDAFRGGHVETKEDLHNRLHAHALLDYTSAHWAHHVRPVQDALLSTVLQVLRVPEFVKNMGQLEAFHLDTREMQRGEITTGLHLITLYNLEVVGASYLKESPGAVKELSREDYHDRQPLYLAAQKGHDKIAKILIEHGADVNAVCGFFYTALKVASMSGHSKVVQLLLENGADPNLNDESRFVEPFGTPLWSAAWRGHHEIVQMLLDRGADINAHDSRYGCVLQVASHQGHEKVVQMLLDRGIDVNVQAGDHHGNALQAACASGNTAVVQLLLDSGANPNVQGGKYGSALQTASHKGSKQIVRLLLARGVNVNSTGGKDENALEIALGSFNYDMASILLENGATIARGSLHIKTTLQAACLLGNVGVVRTLLKTGADVNAPGGSRGPALHAACLSENNYAVVRMLLEHGADVNAEGRSFGSALQAACFSIHSNVQIVQLLLDHGAQVNASGGDSGCALHAACTSSSGNAEVVQRLLDNGADLTAYSARFGHALYAACDSYYEHPRVVQLLLERDVNVYPYVRWSEGLRDPVKIAKEKGHKRIVQMLMVKRARIAYREAQKRLRRYP